MYNIDYNMRHGYDNNAKCSLYNIVFKLIMCTIRCIT